MDVIPGITANRLRDGVVVWLGAAGGWVDRIEQARLFEESTLGEGRAQAVAGEARRLVVGSYAIPVLVEGGLIAPTTQREIIRAKGPTVRTDLGKQSDFSAAGDA